MDIKKPTYIHHHLLFSFKMANLRQALIYKRHPVASRILNHLVKAIYGKEAVHNVRLHFLGEESKIEEKGLKE